MLTDWFGPTAFFISPVDANKKDAIVSEKWKTGSNIRSI